MCDGVGFKISIGECDEDDRKLFQVQHKNVSSWVALYTSPTFIVITLRIRTTCIRGFSFNLFPRAQGDELQCSTVVQCRCVRRNKVKKNCVRNLLFERNGLVYVALSRACVGSVFTCLSTLQALKFSYRHVVLISDILEPAQYCGTCEECSCANVFVKKRRTLVRGNSRHEPLRSLTSTHSTEILSNIGVVDAPPYFARQPPDLVEPSRSRCQTSLFISRVNRFEPFLTETPVNHQNTILQRSTEPRHHTEGDQRWRM